MPRDPQDDSKAFVGELCWHDVIDERARAGGPRPMRVTRLRVNTANRTARAGGLVRIEIETPVLPRVQAQERLRAALGMRKARVVPANRDACDHHAPVGAAPLGLMATAGPPAARIIRAAARAGLIDALATDDVTAERLPAKEDARCGISRAGRPSSPARARASAGPRPNC